MVNFYRAGLALALVAPWAAQAQTQAPAPAQMDVAADIRALRQEMTALRAAHEARMQALEQKLQTAEAQAAAKSAATSPAPAPAAGAAVATAPKPGAAAGANAFNPAVSLILSGLYGRTSRDPSGQGISGFALPSGAEVGVGVRGLSLAESELGLSASIDPWWRGTANIAFHPDDSVSVEEAYVQSTALGHGLTLKLGRFFSGVGYLNEQHAHLWDFVDNPLAYQAMLGTQYGDDGLQLRWLAPTDRYLELGLELGRGRGFPGDSASRNGLGMVALSAHTGGDVGDSHSWRAGLSVLRTRSAGQGLTQRDALSGADISADFSGNTRVWVLDGVWKWAPGGNAQRTNFKLQGEWLRSTRQGELSFDANSGNYRQTQDGWYLQGIYQFLPEWRIGLRTERLDSGRADAGASPWALSSYRPSKHAVMLDFHPSEFSRLRWQVAQDRSQQGVLDRQVYLQYQMSLGAHGAHAF